MRRLLRRLVADGGLRAILKDAGLTTVSAGVSSVFSIIRSALMARYLGVEIFGVWALINSANAVVQKLLSVRAWEWVMVQLSKALVARDARAAGAVFKAGVAIGALVNLVALTAVTALAGWIASTFLHDGSLAFFLRLNALALFASLADETCLATQRVLGGFRWLAAYQVAASLLRLLSVLPVIWLDQGLAGLIAATILVQLLASGTLLLTSMSALRRRLGDVWQGKLRSMWAERGAHARTLFTLSATDTIKVFISDADALLIGYFGTPAAIGVYRAAQNIVLGLQQLGGPYYMVFYPEMTKAAAAGDGARMRKLVRQMAAVGLVLGGGAAVALTALAPLVIRALYGTGFGPSVHLLQIMIWSLLVFSVGWANPMFVSLGRPILTLVLMMIGVVAKIALIAVLVPRFSYDGAAVAYLAHLLIIIPAALLLARHVWRSNPMAR